VLQQTTITSLTLQ